MEASENAEAKNNQGGIRESDVAGVKKGWRHGYCGKIGPHADSCGGLGAGLFSVASCGGA